MAIVTNSIPPSDVAFTVLASAVIVTTVDVAVIVPKANRQ